ncbi:MAG: serine protein kinase RIO [Thermoplasmata archaeon]|nr:serine protein kinase RIO [Thermoplasmata archaeon]
MPKDPLKKITRELYGPKKIERLIKDPEEFKTEEEVFDKHNMMVLFKLMNNGILQTLNYPVSTGKEANVYEGSNPVGEKVAVKIFRTSTATFKSFLEYIEGDPRFEKLEKGRWGVIFTWAKKEFRNLKEMEKAGVKVPHPIHRVDNILVMEMLTFQGRPAPQIRQIEAEREDWEEFWEEVIDGIKRLYQVGRIVHADLSEYNILYTERGLYFIDVAQGVSIEHPRGYEFLFRDVNNVVRFFQKKGVEIPYPEIFEDIMGREAEVLRLIGLLPK